MNTKYLAVLSALIIAAATIGGALLFVDQNDSDESYAIVVTDDAGKEIKLREPLERVAVVNSNIPIFLQILDLKDKVIGMDSLVLTKDIAEYYPGMIDFGKNDAMNGEKMLEANVKHILSPTSMGVKNTEALEALGITVITVECFGETMLNDVDLLVKLFGSKNEQLVAAEKYKKMYDKTVNTVLEKAAEKKDKDPSWDPSFLFQMASSKGDPFYTETAQLSIIVEQIGGHNMIRDLGGFKSAIKQTASISYDAIVDYDMNEGLDYVFIRSLDSGAEASYAKFLSLSSLESWDTLNPILNRNVYTLDTRIASGAMIFVGYVCIGEAYGLDLTEDPSALVERFNTEFGFNFSSEGLMQQFPAVE